MSKQKLLYLSGGIIPSPTANSVHIMKMCQAFQRIGFDVELIAFTFDTSIDVGSVFEQYGVKKPFKLSLFPVRSHKFKNARGFFGLFRKIWF